MKKALVTETLVLEPWRKRLSPKRRY